MRPAARSRFVRVAPHSVHRPSRSPPQLTTEPQRSHTTPLDSSLDRSTSLSAETRTLHHHAYCHTAPQVAKTPASNARSPATYSGRLQHIQDLSPNTQQTRFHATVERLITDIQVYETAFGCGVTWCKSYFLTLPLNLAFDARTCPFTVRSSRIPLHQRNTRPGRQASVSPCPPPRAIPSAPAQPAHRS